MAGRSSQRHKREHHGYDSADETPADHGEQYNNPKPGSPPPDPNPGP